MDDYTAKSKTSTTTLISSVFTYDNMPANVCISIIDIVTARTLSELLWRYLLVCLPIRIDLGTNMHVQQNELYYIS